MSNPASSASHLSNGCIPLGLIREDSRRELLRLLEKCAGSKALVWDPELTEQFGLVAEYSLLKEYEVDRMFPLRPTRLPKSNVQHIVFVTRPVVSLMDHIASNVKKEEEEHFGRKEYHIFFVPWKSFPCIQKLEELGVYGALTNVEEYRLDIIALDYDIMSMENHSSFYDVNIDEDMTSLYLAAKAIVTIQKQYGVIPLIYGKGKCAKNVCGLVRKMWDELGEQPEDEQSQIDRILIIDRTTDLITPLVTQLTYEGLIDEIFGISNTTASFPPEKFSKASKSEDLATEKKKVVLTSKDDLFTQLRNCNFNAVGPTLKRQAQHISERFEERHSAKSVSEMKQFVSHLPQMQQSKASLAIHTNIAELIKEHTDKSEFLDSLTVQQEFLNGIGTDKINPYIEECMFRKQPLIQVLRLLCLQSLTNNGFKPKVYEYYKREIIQTYGFKHMVTLHKLEKCGLLRPAGSWNYNTIRKSLRLIVEDVDEKEPQDIAYVHSGYAPLSIRLAQILSHPGWRSIEEVLKLLPGPTVNGLQQGTPRRKWQQGSISSDGSSNSTVTLVFFVGGVTYAEMSALRFLSSLNDGNEYVVATTGIINGNSLIGSLVEPE